MRNLMEECLMRELRHRVDRDLFTAREPLDISVRAIERNQFNVENRGALRT